MKTRGVGRLATLWRNLSAPQLFVLSFLLLIGLGTVGFEMLPGLYTGPGLSWIDALFTSTSAVCVTGLIVVDTATYFTPAGQAYILLLIQLGGLGIITFTSILVTLMGIRLSLRQERLAAEAAAPVPRIDHRRLARHVILFTLAIELAGAALLFLGWRERLDGALWHAVFHAVSAFCNAGFSTFSDSLVRFADEPLPLMIVMVLIVSGGIGFLTFEEMYLARSSRLEGRRFRLSVHSRLVLLTGATLLGGGWLMFVLFEWSTALGPMSIADKLVNALFMSVTARTAGFNTIDYAQATTSTNFLTILLMMVGGSPGSMAGGMKTTTLALIGLIAWNRLRGRTIVSAWGRSLPAETLQRAVTLFVVMVSVAVAGTFVFTMTDAASVPASSDTKFLTLAFEAVSALNTVGLSMGATPELSPIGRLMTVVLMYLGRVGPLTFALALARRKVEPGYRYAYEDVAIG